MSAPVIATIFSSSNRIAAPWKVISSANLTPAQVKLRLYERTVRIAEAKERGYWGVVYLDRLL